MRRRELIAMLGAAPFALAASADGPDRLIVPGERIGPWTIGVTVPAIDDAIGGTSNARVGTGIADPRPGPDFQPGLVLVIWPKSFIAGGTIDAATGKTNCLMVWSRDFQTLKNIGPQSTQAALVDAYGKSTAVTDAGAPASHLIYDDIGLAVLVKNGVAQQLFVFHAGDGNKIWKF
jgi:hypothetical protein